MENFWQLVQHGVQSDKNQPLENSTLFIINARVYLTDKFFPEQSSQFISVDILD